MKIKQAKVYRLHEAFEKNAGQLEEKMNTFLFSPCPPTLASSMGWIAPLEEEERLVQTVENYRIVCLQMEEKILPAAVVNQHLTEMIKQVEMTENRKLGQKERGWLKQEIVYTLLPKAFSRFIKIYLYVDLKNNWLVINTAHAKRVESALIAMKKTFDVDCQPLMIPHLSKRLTQWLRNHQCPPLFSVEDACVLQDPKNIARVIRCKTQNLFSSSILDLIQDGCEIKQLLLCWQDKVNFVLHDDMSIAALTVKNEDIDSFEEFDESPKMRFFSDFILHSSIVSTLIAALLEACEIQPKIREAEAA